MRLAVCIFLKGKTEKLANRRKTKNPHWQLMKHEDEVWVYLLEKFQNRALHNLYLRWSAPYRLLTEVLQNIRAKKLVSDKSQHIHADL